MSYKLDISYLACVRFYDNKILYLTKSVFDDYDITQDKNSYANSTVQFTINLTITCAWMNVEIYFKKKKLWRIYLSMVYLLF